uniref:non-specific serine/threonine protein kinase n=1 Tax=Kalanchoe fedtschenkoi TaxID=63787 RepID=A0A7N0V038_KALFE
MSCKNMFRIARAGNIFLAVLGVLVPRILVSGESMESEVCGADYFVHSRSNELEWFIVNGHHVPEDFFCETATRSCGRSGFPSADVPCAARRELVQSGDGSPTSYKMVIAVSGAMVLFGCFLCACIHCGRRQASSVLQWKNLGPKDSASSVEMGSDKMPEKITARPYLVPPSPSRFAVSPQIRRLNSVHMDLSQVAKATNNFSRSLAVGEGGFGTVYRAQLPDGQFVAIKRAKKEHFESLNPEFRSEVKVLARIEHRNLVKLLGYIESEDERIIITEYVPNGSLRKHLNGQRDRILDFNQRLEISIDVAHALTYLHLFAEKQIIHRDVKSSNILLTERYRAKVTDFGFARLGPVDAENTHTSTKVKGTMGYLDPEYMRTFKLTPKSDVYSFGVLLIEILTGRRPVEPKRPPGERVTLIWAFENYVEGSVTMLVDPRMQETIDASVLHKIFGLAIRCAAPVRADRPDMKSVAERLWAIRMDYLKTVTEAS